jgi:hypothetical protein
VLRESTPATVQVSIGVVTVQDQEDQRGVRAAKNQSLFREINERIEDLNASFSGILPTGDWVCECAEAVCVETVELSVAEYESIRARSATFVVAPSDQHVWPDVERVIERTDRYWIVEKRGDAKDVAERADPRRP